MYMSEFLKSWSSFYGSFTYNSLKITAQIQSILFWTMWRPWRISCRICVTEIT